ncbi:MAG: hypothetical protein AB8G86_17280 [Saprospiraceae bacterium]
MDIVRVIYRNILFETLLIGACITQIIAGISLFRNKKKNLQNGFDRLHIYSGLYLGFFLTIHPIAIFVGRYYFEVDTNFWFGAMVVNLFPMLLFYVPYYFLGIFAFFAHVACIHRQRVTALGWNVSANKHAKLIIAVGAIVGLLILAGFTGFFQGLSIPDEYLQLLG